MQEIWNRIVTAFTTRRRLRSDGVAFVRDFRVRKKEQRFAAHKIHRRIGCACRRAFVGNGRTARHRQGRRLCDSHNHARNRRNVSAGTAQGTVEDFQP